MITLSNLAHTTTNIERHDVGCAAILLGFGWYLIRLYTVLLR
jgi:hypothetical protein